MRTSSVPSLGWGRTSHQIFVGSPAVGDDALPAAAVEPRRRAAARQLAAAAPRGTRARPSRPLPATASSPRARAPPAARAAPPRAARRQRLGLSASRRGRAARRPAGARRRATRPAARGSAAPGRSAARRRAPNGCVADSRARSRPEPPCRALARGAAALAARRAPRRRVSQTGVFVSTRHAKSSVFSRRRLPSTRSTAGAGSRGRRIDEEELLLDAERQRAPKPNSYLPRTAWTGRPAASHA